MDNIHKTKKYNKLKIVLEKMGWNVTISPFEIGSQGFVTKRNRLSIITVMKRNQIKVKHSELFKNSLRYHCYAPTPYFKPTVSPPGRIPPSCTPSTPAPLLQPPGCTAVLWRHLNLGAWSVPKPGGRQLCI